MIKKIKIQNFQSHKDTTLDLGSGINSIIGDNDSGKTATFRAMEWLRTNRPLGNGFVRKNQPDNALVEIENDCHTISREKGKKTNEYRLSGINEPYTSFGSNPPEEIAEALNLDDINVQSQLELPFLVLSTPGQVAQHIRSISGLDTVDKVVNLLKTKITSTNTTIESKKGRVEEINSKLKILEKIDVALLEELISETENLLEENKEIENSILSLDKIVKELTEVEEKEILLPEDIDSILEEAEAETKCLEEVDRKIEDIEKILNELASLEKETFVLPKDIESIFSEIVSAEKKYNNTEEKIKMLIGILEELVETETRISCLEKDVKGEQEKLFNLLDKIEVCPTCERGDLTEEGKKKVLENY